MEILRQESKYTKISMVIILFLGVSVLANFLLDLPIRMSRICWLILTSVSLILSFLGKREKRTIISSAAIYINIFVLGISLIVFKTILVLIRIVL